MKSRWLIVFFSLILVIPHLDTFQGCGDEKLTQDLNNATLRAAKWLSENLIDDASDTESHILATAFHSLRLVGHPTEILSSHPSSNMNNDQNVDDVGKVALRTQGYISTCQNPKRKFINRLLSGTKKCNKSDYTHSFQYMTAVLALCNSGNLYLSHHAHHIMKSLTSLKNQYQNIDTVAMATIALSCIRTRQEEVQGNKAKHNRNVSPKYLKKRHRKKIIKNISRGTKWLLKRQNADGSFGENGITTALAAQAILSDSKWAGMNWHCSKTMKYLLDQQRADGSFGDLMSTIQILPVLKGAVPHDLRRIKCSGKGYQKIKFKSRKIKTVEKNDITEEDKPIIDVCVKIQFNETSQRRFDVQVKEGSTVHEVFKIASKKYKGGDNTFSFTASKTKYGAMVRSICGVEEKVKRRIHWIMYTSPSTMATVGVDGFRPKNGTCVIFKLKKTGDESLPCKDNN